MRKFGLDLCGFEKLIKKERISEILNSFQLMLDQNINIQKCDFHGYSYFSFIRIHCRALQRIIKIGTSYLSNKNDFINIYLEWKTGMMGNRN